MMRKQKTKSKKQGYVLIEAAFCIFVVGLTLVVFLQVMSKMFVFEFNKRDSIIASNLAQEGIEIIRNIRDNNWKASPPKSAFANPFPANGTYCVEYDNTATLPNVANKLRRDDTTGFYNYTSGTVTKFSRTVEIGGNGDSRTITSTVFWKPIGSASTTETKVTDTLYAWGDP